MHEGTGIPQPSLVPLGLPGVRRTLSAPPSAGATTLPPSMPSLPQVRNHVDTTLCRLALLMLDVTQVPATLSAAKCPDTPIGHQSSVFLPSY